MKKILIRVVLVGVCLILIAMLVMWLLLQRSYQSGDAIPSRSVSMEQVQQVLSQNDVAMPSEDEVLALGSFTQVDPIHWARGEVKVQEVGDMVFVKFSSDFEAANGPDLYIHLSKPQEYGGAKGATIENTLTLGRISSNTGEQVYAISREEWDEYNHSILIWCRAFGIHFSHALLES